MKNNMLKIKDNVNLKELEKFGFEFVEQSNQFEWTKNFYQKAIEDKKEIVKIIVVPNKIVNIVVK